MSLIHVNSLGARTGTIITVLSNLKLNSVQTGTSVNNLGIDASGNVIIGTTGSTASVEVFVTGGTYSNGTTVFTNNTGGTFTVNGFYTGSTGGTEVFVTGGTYSNGSILFTNNTGGTFNVTGFYTGYTAPTDITVTGGTYSNGTTTFTNNTGGTFNITGYYTGSTSGGTTNISDALYTVNNNLNANNTTTATTSVMVYGVNVFTGVTSTNFATKLPQPVTGKSVKVINKGSNFLYIFPSNIGGRINNLPINTPAIIPADGNLYEFICIENPLPGAWTFSPPATSQYDSGEIVVSLSAGTANGFNPWVTAINSTKYTVTKAPFITSVWAYNGKNRAAQLPTPQPSTNTVLNYDFATAFRPDTPWKGITKIKVYTNLLSIVDEFGDAIGGGEIRLNAAGESDYYDITTGDLITNGENNNKMLFRIYPNNVIAGTAVTGSTKYTSANIGDPGTLWVEKVAFTDSNSDTNLDGTNVNTIVQGTFIGNKSQGQVPFPFTGNAYVSQGDLVEKFYSSYISFQIQPLSYENYGLIPDFKFRFIIEYYQ